MQAPSDLNDKVTQEINHRVKNNLQVVSSLLDLQLEFVGKKSPEDIIQTIKQRIQSMAVLHDQLCNSDDQNTIEIGKYLKAVMEKTCISFAAEVNFKTRSIFDKCQISQQKMLLIGLVVNELILNALFYGKDESNSATINLEGVKKEDKFILTISDSGPGFVDSIETRQKKLGLRLVDGLIKQLKGSIQLSDNMGTCWRIELPIGN